jgi:hypothetical protein
MAIKANRETMQFDIINLFDFMLRDNISKWGKNFVQDRMDCTFKELE